MAISKSYKIGALLINIILILMLSYALVSAANVDITKPWHVLSQIARNSTDLTSIDSNHNGRIDVGLTEETLQSITDNGNKTTQTITVGGLISTGAAHINKMLTVTGSAIISGIKGTIGLEVNHGNINLLDKTLFINDSNRAVEIGSLSNPAELNMNGDSNINGNLTVNNYIKTHILCINGECRDRWMPQPISHFNKFVAGFEYPYSNPDPWLRDNKYPYPYITLKHIIETYGVDPTNPYATNWFPMAYSYWQPYRQVRSALFIDEGDNSSPRNTYRKYGRNGWNKIHPQDTLAWCIYIDNQGVSREAYDYNYCYSCATHPGSVQNCNRVVYIAYADSTSNLKGRVLLQIRLKPWWQRKKCNHDYLPGMTLGSWGDPRVTNLKVNPYQFPDIKNDMCYGANIHSVIEGRFVVVPAYGLNPDPIINFYRAQSPFIYMVKDLGIAYLTFVE